MWWIRSLWYAVSSQEEGQGRETWSAGCNRKDRGGVCHDCPDTSKGEVGWSSTVVQKTANGQDHWEIHLLGQYLATWAHIRSNKMDQCQSVQRSARVTNAVASNSKILSSVELVLAAMQLAQSRVSSSAEASVAVQRLATVKTRTTDASYWTQLVHILDAFPLQMLQ